MHSIGDMQPNFVPRENPEVEFRGKPRNLGFTLVHASHKHGARPCIKCRQR